MNFSIFWAKAEFFVVGRLFNWRSAESRRARRGHVWQRTTKRMHTHLMMRAMPDASALPTEPVGNYDGGEKIFSLWLQGCEQAPEVAQACWRSIKRHCPQELVVITAENLSQYTDLPPLIIEKWRAGLITNTHFSDIVRLDLLYRHGGYWIDSTCYVTSPIPRYITREDFFLFTMGHAYPERYSFIQSCFLRARKNEPLLTLWRQAMINYWMHNDQLLDYFMLHLMFKLLVTKTKPGKQLWEQMLHVDQDPTHEFCCGDNDLLHIVNPMKPYTPEEYAAVTSGSFFQKLSYKYDWALNPPPGTMAEYFIKS